MIAVPRRRVGEIANIAQSVEGMKAALGETAQRRAEADEARPFVVTSIAHDLRALRVARVGEGASERAVAPASGFRAALLFARR